MDWLAHGFIERFAHAVDRVARLKRRFTRKAGERDRSRYSSSERPTCGGLGKPWLNPDCAQRARRRGREARLPPRETAAG